MDANEFKQKHRLKRILESHDEVEQRFSEAYDLQAAGEVGADGKNLMLLRAVQSFIREIHNLLMEYSANIPDDQTNVYWVGKKDQPLGQIDFQHRSPFVFYGLRDVHEAEPFYQETWVEQRQPRNCAPKEEEHVAHYTVPEEVSRNAFIVGKMFLSQEHDLEVKFENLENNRPISDWREDNV